MPNTIFFWEGTIGDKEIIAKYGPILEKILTGDHKSLHLEKLNNLNIYSVRLNKSDRLLFTTYKVGDKSYLLILDEVLGHDYHKSRFLRSPTVLKNYLIAQEEALLEQINESDFIATTADFLKELQKPDEENPQLDYVGVNYFNQKFIVLNENQEEARTTTLPAIITGAAGSGKTCVAKALLEQCRAQQFPDETYLYITASKRLASTMEKAWKEVPGEGEAPECVHFMSYEDLLKVHVDMTHQKIVNERYCLEWLANYANHYRKNTPAKKMLVTPEFLIQHQKMQEEFRIICGEPEKYESLGERQCLFNTKSQRAWLKTAFESYRLHLQASNSIDTAFYPLEIPPIYDVVVVDEAQDLSQLQLALLAKMAKNRQIAFCTDSHQSLFDSQSKIPFLQSLVKDHNGNINQIDLPSSHRCPVQVIKAANAILSIKNIVREGTGHKGEYVTISATEKLQNHEGYVQWLTEKSHDLPALREHAVNNNKFAIVTLPEHKAEAMELFKTTDEAIYLIFTPEEIKGLEYESILGYKLFDTQTGFDTNRILDKRLSNGATLDEGTSSNRPKQKTGEMNCAPYLSQLFTTYTRATHSLYIYEESNHKTKALTASVQAQLNTLKDNLPPVQPAPKVAPSREEWLQHANQLRENGNIEQALSIEEFITRPKVATKEPAKKTRTAKKPHNKSKRLPATVGTVKPQLKLTKDEQTAFDKLTKNFSEQNIRPLFKDGTRTPNLIINTPYLGKNSIFMALIQGLILNNNTILLSSKRLQTLRFFESKYITAKGYETSLFYQIARYIKTACEVLGSILSTKQFAEDLPVGNLCETYPGEDNASALYWLSSGDEGCKVLAALISNNPPHALEITMEDLTRTLTNQTDMSSALFLLSTRKEGAKTLSALLEHNPALATEFTKEILYNPILLKNGFSVNSIFYNLIKEHEGREFLKELFLLNPELAAQITIGDLRQSFSSRPPSLHWLCSHENGREILTTLFDADPEIPIQITGEDLHHSFTDKDKPGYSISTLYLLAMEVKGIEFLNKLLDLNTELAQQISGRSLCDSLIVHSKDDEKTRHFAPLFCLVEHHSGKQLLNRLIKENPLIGKEISYNDLCGAEGNFPRNFYWLTTDPEGCKCLNSLLALNPGFLDNFTVNILMHVENKNSNQTIMENLLNSDEGCQFLISLLAVNPSLAQQFTLDHLLHPLEDTHESETIVEKLFEKDDGYNFLKTLLGVNNQLRTALNQSSIPDKMREEIRSFVNQAKLSSDSPSTIFGFFKAEDELNTSQLLGEKEMIQGCQ